MFTFPHGLTRRVLPHNKRYDGVSFILVCYQQERKGTGYKTRFFTGTNKLPVIPVSLVHKWFRHELLAGVPRSKVGRGAFAFGRLVKYVARQGLNKVDGDIRRCFLQLRWAAVNKATRATKYPVHARYLEDPDKCCHELADYSDVDADDIKTAVIWL